MDTTLAQASKSGGKHRTTSLFFGGEPNPATTPFFSASAPQLQRQCASCGKEDEQPIQRKITSENARFFAPTTAPNLQRQLGDENEIAKESPEGEMLASQPDSAATNTAPVALHRDEDEAENPSEIQSQLEIGAGDDPLEAEADAMADHVVQRQTANPKGEEHDIGAVQRTAKAQQAAMNSTPASSLDTSIAHARGGGTTLAPKLQASMEGAFNVDFSSVRVHTGAASAAMNEEIGARAFTHGTDIHFNTGEFAPSTRSGSHLLAHELTHVVQQNTGLRRKPKKSHRTVGSTQGSPAGSNGRIQAKLITFGPAFGVPKGNDVHKVTLPLFVKKKLNPDVWIETPMPGASKAGVARGKTGYADFYRDKTHNTTIGIKEGKLGGLTNIGSAMAAPKPPLTETGPVQELGRAPQDIELGDLKPGNSGEEDLGTGQIDNYSTGITNTAAAVNKHQNDNNHKGRWKPSPSTMTSLTVPDKLTKSSKKGVYFGPLAVWEWLGRWKKITNAGMKGSLVIYKSRVPGIWAYEWMPHKVPADIGNDDVINILGRLDNDVKPRLDSSKKTTPKLKDGPTSKRLFPQRQAPRPRLVQRQPKKNKNKFDNKAWETAYNPWRRDADKVLGISSGKRKDAVFEALTRGKKRTGVSLTIPAKVQDRAKAFATVKHWFRFGKYYAWFRKTFNRLYVKLAAFGQSVKAKVKRLSKSVGGSRFGNWIKAAARAIFKVFKTLGSMAISQIADKLLESFQQGVSSAVKKLVNASTPDAIKSKIEEIRELKETFDKVLAESQEKLEERLFGDKLKMFSKLDTFMRVAQTVSTIVSVVKWGIRIAACASPPVVGCLWNLAIAALEFAFAKIMQTCWFSAKVFKWIKDFNIRTVLDFPTNVAKIIIEKANKAIPLPAGIGPLFAPIIINPKDFDIKCGSGGGGGPMSPEQEALMQLVQDVGEKKFEAFMEMLAKRGAGPRVQLTIDRIQKLKPLIDSLTEKQMKDVSAGKATGINVSLDEFIKDIGTHTTAEKESIAARDIDYEKAQRSNPKFERDSIKWKPTLFVRKGVASDSREFADAIFDIQTILRVKTDGMAGAITTARFYEANGLAKDGAYRNAKEELEIQQIAKVMGSKFKHIGKLKADLTTLSWGSLKPGHVKLSTVDKRRILYARTSNGARLGAYYKDFLVSEKGKTKATRKVVALSHFINLDPIKSGDGLGVFTTRKGSGKERTELGDTFLGDITANSTLEIGNVFIGVAVDDF